LLILSSTGENKEKRYHTIFFKGKNIMPEIKKDKNGMMIDEHGKWLDFGYTTCDICSKNKSALCPFPSHPENYYCKAGTSIEKAKAFSQYQTQPEPEQKSEKQKIHAVVIIGLYSGERIMKDIYSEQGLQDELKHISDLPVENLGYLFGTYYLNGQRHILCHWIDINRIESISYTLTGELNKYAGR